MQHGSLVECVFSSDGTRWRLDLGGMGFMDIVKGVIYTVNELVKMDGSYWVSLFEIPDLDKEGQPHYYHVDYFREIQPPMDITSLIEETKTVEV